jgi:hypothetical protein
MLTIRRSPLIDELSVRCGHRRGARHGGSTGDKDVRDHAARRVQILTLRVPIRHSALVECFASFRHRQTYFPSCAPV